MTRRPRLRSLAVVAALLAACGGDDPTVTEATSTSGAAPGAGGTTTAPSTDGAPGAAPAGAATHGDGDGEPGSAASPGSAPPAPTGPAAASPALDPSGPPGSFAPSVLRADRSSRVVLEIQVAPGAEPSAATVEHLRSTLAAATGKPIVVTGGGAAPDRPDWSSASVREAADAGAATPQGGGTAVLRLLFLRGAYEGSTGVLGVAVRGDVAAVFVDQATSAAGLLGDPQAIVVSVATHELGHLLGLVDLVLATGRADPEHPGHSASSASVMYWAVESDLVASLLGTRPPRDFDADDLADLRTIAAGG